VNFLKKLKIPFVNLGRQYELYREQILDKFDSISKAGAFILGEENLKFEEEFSEYCGTRYALGLANGTDALILPLKACGISEGDEVITPAHSFIASAGAIAFLKAKPVYVDIKEDLNINVDEIEAAITPKTKAILPVHFTGKPAEMNKINSIAQKYNLKVIEDAAQAVGGHYYGKSVGNLGDAAGFSLHPLKNLFVHGDAGIVTTNDKNLYERMKVFRNHGLVNRDQCEEFSMNSRLDEIQAAIARIKLRDIEKITKRIIDIALYYNERLSKFIKVPELNDNIRQVFHCYIIKTDHRQKLQQHLEDCGIETKIHYPIPLYKQNANKIFYNTPKTFEKCDEIITKILSLPIYPELSDDEVEFICDSILQLN